jgi:hypothetical protein
MISNEILSSSGECDEHRRRSSGRRKRRTLNVMTDLGDMPRADGRADSPWRPTMTTKRNPMKSMSRLRGESESSGRDRGYHGQPLKKMLKIDDE